LKFAKDNPKAVELLETLFNGEFRVFINSIVYSEVFFIFLKAKTGKGYWELKKDKETVKATTKEFLETLFPLLSIPGFLEPTPDIIMISNELSMKYGLLPNDSLILATCKYYGIQGLVSLDSDFEDACRSEGVLLINSAEKLKSLV